MENNEETQAQLPNGNSDAGSVPSTASIIDQLDIKLKRMEGLDKSFSEKLGRYESLLARNMLSGRAEAGTPVAKPKTEDDAAQEMADSVIKKYYR